MIFNSNAMDKSSKCGEPRPEIEFRGTVADFKKYFGESDCTQNLDSVVNFEDYIFELAFEKGNLPVARWFIEHGGNIDKLYKREKRETKSDGTGIIPLIAVVENGHLSVANVLLAMGANPNGVDCKSPNAMLCMHPKGPGNPFICKNRQALPLAIYKGNIGLAKTLIAAGAERDYHNEMKSAVTGGSHEMVKALCDMGNKNNSWLTMRTAVFDGNTPVVKLLLENSNLKYMPSESYDCFNYATLVVDSILNDKPEITDMLLDAQPTFEVNSRSWSGRGPFTRPLIAAIEKNNLVVATDLIRRGAWLNPALPKSCSSEIDSIDLNPLYAAAHADNMPAVTFLLEHKANPHHLARYHGSLFSEPRPVLEFIRDLKKLEGLGVKRRPNLDRILQILGKCPLS